MKSSARRLKKEKISLLGFLQTIKLYGMMNLRNAKIQLKIQILQFLFLGPKIDNPIST